MKSRWHVSIPLSLARFSSPSFLFFQNWAADGFDIFYFIRLFDTRQSTRDPSPNTVNQELRLNQFTSFCNIFHYLTKPRKISVTLGFYSQYYYDWNVLHVEGICDVSDFILLTALVVHYNMNPPLPRPAPLLLHPQTLCETLSSSRRTFIKQRAPSRLLPTGQHDTNDLTCNWGNECKQIKRLCIFISFFKIIFCGQSRRPSMNAALVSCPYCPFEKPPLVLVDW